MEYRKREQTGLIQSPFTCLIKFQRIFSLHRKTAGKIADRIGRLENVLNECIERVLDEREHIQIEAICLLIKAYTNHKGSIDCFSIQFNIYFTESSLSF